MGCCRKPKALQLPEPENVGAIAAVNAYYNAKVVPMENRHLFPLFYTPQYDGPELEGKPIVMLLGQYSVGKTSLIEYLLGGSYPGAAIGPEPTTDFFAHVQYSEAPVTIEGPTLVSDKDYPLKGLAGFGNGFLTRLRSTNFNAELLKHISILDTPGILAGQKQTDSRGYNFSEVVRFLAERVDRIILMFDAAKVDISDEYKSVIQSLDGHSEKVMIVLNKSDSVPPKELIRVRGALMWNLGKILTAPEVPKVYIGSFWKFLPPSNALTESIIEDDDAFIKEICDLVNTYRAKRVNDVVKRAKLVRVHCLLMDATMRRKNCFRNLQKYVVPKNVYPALLDVEKKHRLVHEDMPNVNNFCTKAAETNFKHWRKIDKKLMNLLDEFLEVDVGKFVNAIKKEPQTNLNYKPADRITKPPEETRKPGSELKPPVKEATPPKETASQKKEPSPPQRSHQKSNCSHRSNRGHSHRSGHHSHGGHSHHSHHSQGGGHHRRSHHSRSRSRATKDEPKKEAPKEEPKKEEPKKEEPKEEEKKETEKKEAE